MADPHSGGDADQIVEAQLLAGASQLGEAESAQVHHGLDQMGQGVGLTARQVGQQLDQGASGLLTIHGDALRGEWWIKNANFLSTGQLEVIASFVRRGQESEGGSA